MTNSHQPNKRAIQKQTLRLSAFLALLLLLGASFWAPQAGAGQAPPPTPQEEAVASSVGPLVLDPADGPFMLAPEYTGCGGVTPPGVVNAAWEQEVLDRVNTERANNTPSLPPLKRVTLLDGAARYHSRDMIEDNYFSHDTYDGNTLICSFSSRLSSFYSNWNYIGENIAAGYSSPAAVMAGWMGSSGHRANILRDTFTEIGIGYYNGGNNYYHYWTQDFGRRNGQYPLIINRDAASTTNRTVNIYLYGSFTEMQLAYDSGGFGAWQPFQNSFSVTLPCLSGTRTVTAKMRDYDGGTEYTSFDTIGLTATNCAVLGGLPNSVAFMYSKASPGTLTPASLTFTPVNTASSIVMNWSVSESIAWLSVSGATGSTPGSSFTLTPVSYAGLAPGTHSGNVSVTVTDPADAQGSPKVITVTLTVVADSFRYLYMPYIRR